MSISFTIFCYVFLRYSVLVLELLNANTSWQEGWNHTVFYLSYTFTYHISKVNKWLSRVKQFSTSHASRIMAMKILIYYTVRYSLLPLFFWTHVYCTSRGQSLLCYHPAVWKSHSAISAFHCHFQMFNEATHGYEMSLLFLLPSLYRFQSQNYWINGNTVTSSVLHFLSKTPIGGGEKCGEGTQCRFVSFFAHCLCGRT